MKKIVYNSGKQIYKRLPPELKHRALSISKTALYRRHTVGIVPNEEAFTWASQHKRPVSIVIPSYNDYKFLAAAVQSVKDTCSTFEYEVIIVDDYCRPDNIANLKRLEGNRVRVIFRSENGGFGKAVNTGMREAKYDVILLNSDIVALPGWLESLQHTAYAIDPNIGMVSPKLVYPDGRIQYGGTYHAKVLAPQWFGHLYVGRAANDAVANVPGYNRSISGACVYIRRPVIDAIGLLDEAFWLGFEDVDYGLRALAKGFRAYYQPHSMLIHHESASRGYSQGIRELASMRYFWNRWQDTFFTRMPAVEKLELDIVISSASSRLWQDHIQALAIQLGKSGHDVHVHTMTDIRVDEEIIDKLSAKESLKICADWGASETVWLSSLEHGRPVYLLPDIESGQYPNEPTQQAQIIARYRPEFFYVAPSRWVRDQLKAEAAWDADIIALAPQIMPLRIPAKPVGKAAAIVVIGSEQLASDLKLLPSLAKYGVSVVATKEVDFARLQTIAQQSPNAIVYEDLSTGNALLGLGLVGTGVPVVSFINEKTRYEILDGYNSLQAQDITGVEKSLLDILGNVQVAAELRANGVRTLQRYSGQGALTELTLLLSRLASREL